MTDPDYDTAAGDVDDLAEGDDGFNPDDPEDAQPAEPWHVEFAAWVQEHFARVEFFTDAQKIRWCPTWWEHPEAVERLKAAWLAYRMIDMSDDLAAVSEWWLNHWDAHRVILFHDKGPFRNCDADRGHLSSKNDQRVLPVPALPPDDWKPAR